MDKRDILTELLLDESFQAWVLSGGKDEAEHWQNWIKDHPDQQGVLDRAKMTMLRLSEEKYHLPEERKNTLRQQLISMTKAERAQHAGRNRQEKKWSKSGYRIAAAMLLLLSLGGLLYLWVVNGSREVRYGTAYGEIKTILLPDSTKVTLNGNSSISYAYHKNEGKQRDVWLQGEGFFDVTHIHSDAENGDAQAVKFVVHTDNLSIQVLGTRFNVKHRDEKTQVVLEKGSIQLDIEAHDDALLMQPGELVEVNKGQELISQKVVAADDYIAWKEGMIHFEGAGFEEISSVLKDNYGFVLHFENKEDAELINLRGSFPTQNIDVLLEAIANITHTTMKKKGKTIIYQ